MSYLNKSQGVNITVGVPTDKRMKIAYRERITVETIANPAQFLYDTSQLARWEGMEVYVSDARTKAEREAGGIVYSATFKLVGGLSNNYWKLMEQDGVVVNYRKQLYNFSLFADDQHGIWSQSAIGLLPLNPGNFVHSVTIYGPGIEAAIANGVAGNIKIEDTAQRYVVESPSFASLAAAPLNTIIDTDFNNAVAYKQLHFPVNAELTSTLLMTILGDLSAYTQEAIIKIVYEI